MPTTDGTSPLYVKNLGQRTALTTYIGCAILAICGPALIVFASLTPNSLIGVVGGCVLTLVAVPFSIRIWRGTRRSVERALLLESHGIAGTAEIVTARPSPIGENRGFALELRIRAAGMVPFAASLRCADDDRLRVGEILQATVDPESRAFMIDSPALRGEHIRL